MARKKTQKVIHRSPLSQYSRGEGARKYYAAESERRNLYMQYLMEEEENKRKKFVEDYKNELKREVSEEDAELLRSAFDTLHRLDNQETVDSQNIGSRSLTGMYDISAFSHDSSIRKNQILKQINDTLSKYSSEALHNAGFDLGFMSLLWKNGILAIPDSFVKRDSDTNVFDTLATQTPMVLLDTTGVRDEIQAYDDSLQQYGQNVLPEVQVTGDANRRRDRINALRTMYEDYDTQRANYEYNLQQGRVAKPEGYGFWSSQWWNDATGTYLSRLNETQAESFMGRIAVSNERLTRARNAVAYLDALDRIDELNGKVRSGERLTYDEISELERLNNSKRQLLSDYSYIQSIIPSKGILGLGDFAEEVKKAINDNFSPSQDLGTEWFDRNDWLRVLLRGVDSKDKTTRHNALKNFERYSNIYQAKWKNGAIVNLKEKDEVDKKYKVSEWFKQQEGTVSDDFFSLDSWLYKQPGLLGASQSSALKQWTSTALNLVGGGLAKGLIKKLALGSVTLPMQVSASLEENYAEVGDNYVTRLKNMLKSEGEYEKFIKEASDKLDTTDEDEIFTQFKLGNFVPTSKKQLEITARAAYGLGALYQTDMMATTYDDVFTTALELTPLGHLSKATRTGRIAQSMTSGSMVGPSGMLFKPVLDYASSKIAKTSVGQALKKRVAGLVKFAEEMPEKMLGKYNIFGKSSIPHRVLGQKGYMRYAALKGAGKDLGGRVFRSSLSEGIEEGKQYLNAQKYISGEFDDREYMGLLNVNRMLDDAEGFAKSAVVMAGFPLFLSFTNDKELIANIKGGMKGGFMQTGATMTAQSVIPTIQQVRQTDRLFEMYLNVLLDKMAERDFYEKGAMFAREAAGGADFARINTAFDNLIASVNQRGKSQEDIDGAVEAIEEQRKMALRIFGMTNTDYIKKGLRDNGIEENTDEAFLFVSLANLIGMLATEARDKRLKKFAEYKLMITKLLSPFTVEENTGNVIDERIRRHTGNVIESYVKPIENKNGERAVGEELARISDLEFRSNVERIANIAALILLQLDLNAAKTAGNTRFGQSKKDIDFLLKEVQAALDDNLSIYKSESRKTIIDNARDLLVDVENKDELIDTARQAFLYESEENYFNTMLDGIFGVYTDEGTGKTKLATSKFNGKSLIEQINKNIEDDFKLSLEIEQEWLNVQYKRFEDRQQLVKSKLEKAAKKAQREAEKAAKRNRPESVSDTTEKNENGKSRKKRKTLADKLKNKKKQEKAPEIVDDSKLGPVVAPTPVAPNPEETVAEKPVEPVAPTTETTPQPAETPQPVAPTPQSAPQTQEQDGRILGRSEGTKKDGRGRFANSRDKARFELLGKKLLNRGRLTSGPDPEILGAVAEMMYLEMKGAVVHIAEAARDMIINVGDAVRPYLKLAYNMARDMLQRDGIDTSGMSSIEDVEKFDADNFYVMPEDGIVIPPDQQPTGEPGDSQVAADKAFSTNELLKAYNRLVQKSIDDQEKIDINLRTGHDYFIKIDGKLVMFPRVHDYLDPQYEPNELEQLHLKQVTDELREAYKKGLSEFSKKAKEFAKAYNEEFKNRGGFQEVVLDTYLQYVKDNPSEVEDVIDAIANLTSRIPADYGVVIGSLVDDICRAYFSGKPIVYTREMAQLIDREALYNLIDELKQIKLHYTSLGWALFAEPIRFYTTIYDRKTGTIKRVAGETDMIAVDKDGHYHIIDFKTSYKSYADSLTPGGARFNNLDTWDTPALNDRRFKVRTTRQYYGDQLSMYNVMIQSSLAGSIVDSMELLPFVVKYAFEWVSRKTSLGESVSREFIDMVPVYSISNLSHTIDENNKIVKDENGNIVRSILRVPIDMSTGIAERFLTSLQQQLLYSIRDKFAISALDEYTSLSDEDKQDVSKNTFDEIKSVTEEYTRLMDIVPQTMDDWISLFKQLELLQDRSNLAIQLIYTDIQNALDNRRAAEENKEYQLLLEETFVDPGISMDDIIAESFRQEVGALYRLVMKLYDRGVADINGVTSEELTQLSNYISAAEKTLRDYPFVEQLKPRAMEYYTAAIDWVNKNIGELDDSGQPIQLINESQVREYTEAWKYMTTTWKATIDGSRGIEDSVATDNASMKLLSVTANPDFITDAVFELAILPIKINGVNTNRLHLIVHYKGHTYQPVSIHTAEGSDIFKRVLFMQRDNRNKHIIVNNFDVHRTNGRMIPGARKSIKERGIVNDPWDTEYTSNLRQFGITRIRKNPKTGLNDVVLIVPGVKGGIKKELYNFGPSKDLTAGMMFMVINPVLNEHTVEKPSVPIRIYGSTLTSGDIDLIIGILLGKFANHSMTGNNRIYLDQEFVEDGIAKGFTNRQILNMLLPYGGRIGENKRVLHVAYDGENANVVHVYGYIEGEEFIRGENGLILDLDNRYDITNASDVARLRERLSHVKINLDERILSARLMDDVSATHPFKGITALRNKPSGAKKLASGEPIRFGKSRIVFDLSDLEDANHKSELRGISGLGYYIKRGFVESDFGGIENALLSIDNNPTLSATDELVAQQRIKPEVTVQQLEQSVSPFEQEASVFGGIEIDEDDYLPKIQTGEANVKLDSEEKVRKHLHRIFGIQGVPFVIRDRVLDVLSQEANVVGRCYADAIELSSKAPRGTEFHEAFHRVAEILMTKQERDNLYDMYRKAHNMPIPKNEEEREESDKTVREEIADSFMYYMSDAPKLAWSKFAKPFKYIKEWVNWYKNIGSFKLFWFYTQVGLLGRFHNAKAMAEDRNRFANLYKNGMNMVINDRPFKHVLNKHMYRKLRKTLVFCVLEANKIDPSGDNIQDLSLDKDVLMESKTLHEILTISNIHTILKPNSIFRHRFDNKTPKNIQLAFGELVDNWDAVKLDVAKDISKISTDYQARYERENEEDAQSADAEFARIELHIKASYEFSAFSRTSSRVRFFLSRIPNTVFKTKNGKILKDEKTGLPITLAKLNELGLVEYMDTKFVYNSLLNRLHNVRSKDELLQQLRKLALSDPMYFHIYSNLKALAERAKTNVNDSQLFTLIYGSIRSVKNEFEIAKATKTNNESWNVSIISSGSEYAAKNYRREWSDNFANGGCLFVKRDESGRIVMNGYHASIFNSCAVVLNEIAYAFSDKALESKALISVSGTTLDISKDAHVEGIKRKFILILNMLGILFDMDMLNFMLQDKYGNSGWKGMHALLNLQFGNTDSSTTSSFESFIRLINDLYVNKKLAIDEENKFMSNGSTIDATKLFTGKGASFVSELSTYKYNYRHNHDQLLVLVTKGNKFYVMSENNVISDITQELRDYMHGAHSDDVENGMAYEYNIFSPEDAPVINGRKLMCGSIIYKTIQDIRDGRILAPNIKLVTFGGFRTDDPTDQGEDYMGISQREDYISKVQILLSGGLIFPTMSDKKSWNYLRGFILKGINHTRSYSSASLNKFGEDGSFSQLADVSQLIWEYAMCERRAIGNVMAEINGYVDENGIEHPKLSDAEKVDNFHGITVTLNKKKPNERKINVIQGARFTSLLGVYATVNGEEKYIEFNRILDEKGNELSELDNIDIADKYFFNAQEITDPSTGEKRLETEDEVKERQLKQIEYSLLKQLVDELEYAEELGLIERNASLSGRPSIEQYRNVGLNQSMITQIATALAEGDHINYNALTNSEQATKDLYDARAIAVIINDAMVRHIQSIEEVERVYSGNPAFFKFGYDDAGHLVDRTTDQSKRFGGLVSTGLNNDMELGLPESYVLAEVDEDDVPLTKELADNLEDLFIKGELRSAYINHVFELNGITISKTAVSTETKRRAQEIVQKADKMSVEKLKLNLPEDAYNIAIQIASSQAKKFRVIEDVSNGAAYMTDEMCENLLRMSGSWNDKVEKAFQVLRGNVASAIEQQEAYNLIYTTVIGSQKYTAFGFRNNRNTQIPYYNKMALFPLFKCICTGNMAKIYDKMKLDGVDMLCVKSAVKTGGLGSKAIDWSKFNENYTFEENFHFNTYKLKYDRLRKQFNTDPSGKEMMNMGTQMMKVALSAIIAGRDYTLSDGTVLSADAILKDIMTNINGLSDIGVKNIEKQFFDGDKFDIEKFSKFLTLELTDRDASEELIDAVSIVRDGKGNPHFKVPLSAISNLNFIQSIIVSKINKEVVDVKTPGAPFILRSIWNLEGETRVLGDKNLPNNLYYGKKLLMINEEGSMDCVLSIDFFDDLIPKNKDGSRKSFKEARQYLIDNGIISGYKSTGEWSNAKANITAARIPTQAISSIHALRCVDVIPAVRDTVILPMEFVTITGSDFDIDKLYLSRKNYRPITEEDLDWINSRRNTDESREIHAESNFYDIKHRNLTDRFAEGTAEYMQNRLLDEYIALLCDTVEDENGVKVPRSVNLLHASIDSHTDLIKDIVKDFESGINREALRPFSAYMLRKLFSTKEAFKTGKFGIGPFALNNNSHILTMLYNVSFKNDKNSILSRLGKDRLDRSLDDDGRSILAWLSGLINIHVDAAKDPVADKLNIGKYTYNLINLMVRTGFGKKTFWFTSQPIMRALAEAYNNAQSSYMADGSMSKSARAKEAEESVIINFAKANGYTQELAADINTVVDTWKKSIESSTVNLNANELIDHLLSDNAVILHDIAKNKYTNNKNLSSDDKYVINANGEEVALSFFDIQMAVYIAKKLLDPYAEALSDLVKYTKIDTKKQGKTVSEQLQYIRGVNKLFGKDSKSKSRQLFDTKSLDRLYTESFIKHKTENATRSFLRIMGNTSVLGTRLFQDQVNQLMTDTQNDDFDNASTIRQIAGELLAKRKSQFFTDYAKRHDIDIDGLISGTNTMYDRLGRIKILVQTDPRYAHLRDADGEVSNYMLKTLTQGYSKSFNNMLLNAGTLRDQYNEAKFLDTFTFIDDESVNADDFSEAWEQLLFDDSLPEVLEFARDLIVYAFFTAGDNGGNHDLFKFVPNSWKVNPELEWIMSDLPYSQDSYAYFMEQLLNNYKSGGISAELFDADKEDIILNNWFDNTFIKTEHITKDGETRFTEVYAGKVLAKQKVQTENGIEEKDVQEMVSFPSVLLGITNTPEGWHVTYENETIPKYIKIRRTTCGDKESLRRFVIYKYIGKGVRYQDQQEIYYPVYVQVDARGNKLQRGNRILQYGRLPKKSEAMDAMFNANHLFALFRELSATAGIQDLPSLFLRVARQFATVWNPQQRDNAVTAAMDMGPVVREVARRIRPSGVTAEDAENWSRKEGWSVDYFYEKVYPRRNEAWLIEFEVVDDSEKATKSGTMNHSFGQNSREDVSSETTIEAVRKGERTATTRYESDGNIDYWKSVNIGEIIEFHDNDGNTVKVRCTKRLTKLEDVFAKLDQPEGTTTPNKTERIINLGEQLSSILDQDNQPVTIHYSLWKKLLDTRIKFFESSTINQYELLVDEVVDYFLANHYSDDPTSYDKLTKNITIDGNLYKIITEILNNQEVIRDIYSQYNFGEHLYDDVIELLLDYGGNFEDYQDANRQEAPKLYKYFERYTGDITRQEAEQHPDVLYIFTDNTDRNSGKEPIDPNSRYALKYGKDKHHPGGTNTSAVLRGLDNAYPISTQHWYHQGATYDAGNWKDEDINEFLQVINDEINDIIQAWQTGKYKKIVITGSMFNGRISKITKERTPQLYDYLHRALYSMVDQIEGSKKSYEAPNTEIKSVLGSNDVMSLDYQEQRPSLIDRIFGFGKKKVSSITETESEVLSDIQDVQQPENESEANDSVTQQSGDTIQGQLGVDKEQLISLLGATMYKANVEEVAVKELIQNAFDAVKIAKANGEIQDAHIDVTLDNENRVVTVLDNGIGMSPDVVLKAFFTIGGSYKGDNVDNRLKSGGLGLAKMAFLFSSEEIEVISVHNGVKTTVKTNPLEIKTDNFKIVTQKTTEPNGTIVSVKIPKVYLDENGEERDIWFTTSPSFLSRTMLGDVTINVKRDYGYGDPIVESHDKSKIPEGFVSMGTAHTDFGDIDIYIAEDGGGNNVYSQILISGLYLFNHSFRATEGEHIKCIINILPSVGVKSPTYPINNQREGFRGVVEPEVKDLNFLLDQINSAVARRQISASFDNSISMDVDDVSEVKREVSTKNILEESINDVVSDFGSSSRLSSDENKDSNELDFRAVRTKREALEKSRNSSFDSSDVKFKAGKLSKIDTSKFDINKPLFHNNTTMILGDDAKECLKELGQLLMELKSLYIQTYEGAGIETRHGNDIIDHIKSQFWGFSFDKSYGGVNVHPSIFSLLAINPFYHIPKLPKVNAATALTEYITHLIIHEFNHNYAAGEGAEFTGRFPLTYAEFAGIGKQFNKDWKNKLYLLIEKHLAVFTKYEKLYEQSTNLGESFDGSKIEVGNTGNDRGARSNGADVQGDRSRGDVSSYGEEVKGLYKELSKLLKKPKEQNTHIPRQIYYSDPESKVSFIKNEVSKVLKGQDFRIKKTDSTTYAMIVPRNVVKDYYSFEDMERVVEKAIQDAGGSPYDFNIRPAQYSQQGVIITGKRSISVEALKSMLKDCGKVLEMICGG